MAILGAIEKSTFARNDLNSLIPIASIVVYFALDDNMTMEENLNTLNKTIESILSQDYDNLEIIVVSDCYFWQEYIELVTEAKPFGNVVTYVHLSNKAMNQYILGGYLLLMNAGELLKYSGYLKAALKVMVTHHDIGIVFANYDLIGRGEPTVGNKEEMNVISTFTENSWTKIQGKELFFNYDQYWCMPGATIFRRKLWMDSIDTHIKKLNKWIFLRILLKTNVAFYNHKVVVCGDGFHKEHRGLALEHCHATLGFIDLAINDALLADCEKSKVETWRILLLKKYFYEIVTAVPGDGSLLNGFYDISKKFGVMKILHETILHIFHNKQR